MSRKLIHVAAAAIRNSNGEFLIAKRADNQHQGGLWEFPGGKVELGEEAISAIARELHEELGIEVLKARPLIKVPYHYSDKSVLLDVFEVTEFNGDPWGREGQPIQWVSKADLETFAFPAANGPILDACVLPSSIAITPAALSVDGIVLFTKNAISEGAEAVMLRAHTLSDTEFSEAYSMLKPLCESLDVLLLANTSLELAKECKVDALHLSSARLAALAKREQFSGRWLSASCHNAEELGSAVDKGIDFVTLSPVQTTGSHPGVEPLGWTKFQALANGYPIPVYALGGLGGDDVCLAQQYGGQGIAAIRSWLSVAPNASLDQ